MAYEPINWQAGDIITSARLNRMDKGWGVGIQQLFNETVTTTDGGDGVYGAELAYSGTIDADTITVTFDGTEYICPRIDFYDRYFYGGFNGNPDFTTYPFFIQSNSNNNANAIITENAGEHAVAATVTSIQISEDFAAAVIAATANPILPLRCVEGVTTYNEANSAMENGRLVYFTANDETYSAIPKCFMVNKVDTTCTIVPTSTKIAAKFSRDDGLFYIQHISS